MKKEKFSTPLKKHETVIGWFYLVIHMFAAGELIVLLDSALSLGLNNAQIDLVYYITGFLFLLVFLFSFLRSSFSDLCDNIGRSLTGIILGYAAYYILTLAVLYGLSFFLDNGANPNAQAVSNTIPLNPNAIKAIGFFLAPFVEEILFRGVVFGSIRKSNRVLAYVISTLLFSLYHVWSAVISGHDWFALLYILQYVPASVVLAACYERSRNIWAPMCLHALVNFISISVQLMM